MMGIGYTELLLVFLIVLLFFGGRKIPEIARGLGRGIHEFKKARDDIRGAIDDETAAAAANDTAPARAEDETKPPPASG